MLRKISVWLIAFCGVVSTYAQTLVSGNDVKVEALEIRQDMTNAPVEARQSLSVQGALQNNLANIYVRRVLMHEAKKNALDKNTLVIAAIAKATERILSDARLEQIDQANQPSLQAIEAYAASTYKANGKRFAQDAQVKVRHILIKAEEADAKAKAEAILKDLNAGADFEKLAKEQSQDPGSAAKGGDLGWVSKGRTVKPFEDAALALSKPGQVSPVISTPFGFHIIKLDDLKPAGTKPFEEVKDVLMKEAQGAILNQGRINEQERILKDVKFNDEAIEAMAKEFAKP